MPKSLRARLLISHLAVIALVFALTAAAAFVPLRRAQNRLEVRRLEALAGPVALQAGFIMSRQTPNADRLLDDLLDLLARRLSTHLVLLRRDGTVLHDTDPASPLPAAVRERLVPRLGRLPRVENARRGAPAQNAGVYDGQRIVLAPVPASPDLAIALVAPARRFPLARELFLPLALASLVGLVGAVVATLFLSRSIARPITRLTQAADAVAAGDLTATVPGEASDEVGRLVRSFNAMVARLSAAQESQRRLLANIAHELRTPLTSIQGYAQALADDLLPSERERREALETIVDEAERVSDLVVQILQLARLESGEMKPRVGTVDVAELIGRIARRHRIAAEEAGIDLAAEVDVSRPALADEALLDQAIDNLVRNALRHTPRGGRVTISAAEAHGASGEGSRLRVRVSDTGPGISPEDLPHIFDRFYRAEPSEPADGREGGFGLGLTIVREIVVAHGGRVDVESRPGRGTTFTLDLPLPAQAATPGVEATA